MNVTIEYIHKTQPDNIETIIADLKKIAHKTIETINKEDLGFTFNEDLTIIIEYNTRLHNTFVKTNNTVYLYIISPLCDYKEHLAVNLRRALGVPEYYTENILYNKLQKYSDKEPISSAFNRVYGNETGLGIYKNELHIPRDMVLDTPPDVLHNIIINLIKFHLTNNT